MRVTRRFRIGVKRPKILPASGRSGFPVLCATNVLAIVRTSPEAFGSSEYNSII